MSRYKRAAWAMAALLSGAMMLSAGGAGIMTAAAQEASQSGADAVLKEQRLNTWYSQAISSINNEDYENALLCLDLCITACSREANPELYADLYLKRGYCYTMTGRHEEAIEALDEALDTDPALENAVLLKVSAFSELGRFAEAVESLEQYIELTGDNSMYETMAALYEAQGEADLAYESYEKYAQETSGSEGEAAFACGVYRMQRGQYEQAAALFSESLASEEPADDAYYNRGLCYMSLGDYEKAAADFDASVEAEESSAREALYTKATCEMTLLDYENAVVDFTACIEQDAEPENSRINRGICLLLSGKGEEALSDFDECIEKDINADEARFYRSYVYLAAKEYEKALEDLTTCIDNGYDLAASYLQRAQVYKEMGDEEAYRADLEASRNVGTENAPEQEAEEEAVSEAADEAADEEEAVSEAVTES